MKEGFRRLVQLADGLLRGARLPAILFLATRLGIALAAYLSGPIVVDNPVIPPYHLRGTENLLVDVFGSRWDTGFYVSIVEEGYKFEGVVLPSVPFFPLLPLVMRALLPITGDAVTAGILAANLALMGAAVLFYRLVELKWGSETAGRAVWYLLIFPLSFFGSAIYSESLFLLAAISALLFARQGRWEAAAAAGFLAGLSRFMGLIVAPLLFVEWLVRRRGPEEGRPPWTGLLAAASVPLGTLAYMGYLNSVFGDAGIAALLNQDFVSTQPGGARVQNELQLPGCIGLDIPKTNAVDGHGGPGGRRCNGGRRRLEFLNQQIPGV